MSELGGYGLLGSTNIAFRKPGEGLFAAMAKQVVAVLYFIDKAGWARAIRGEAGGSAVIGDDHEAVKPGLPFHERFVGHAVGGVVGERGKGDEGPVEVEGVIAVAGDDQADLLAFIQREGALEFGVAVFFLEAPDVDPQGLL